jgi:uncharacterized protein (DUF952 family)
MPTSPKYIFKIITAADWLALQTETHYAHESLAQEGFIHFALENQILAVANKHFSDKKELRLIVVNTDLLECPWVVEDLKKKGIFYPHLYGKLNTSAIEAVYVFDKNEYGSFELPEAIKRMESNL